ncbi:MBL fold metallo-hydrolase [Ectobacillus ponti]|uniref:MBL fold metallo-hydrolase n=1 Tax=Ectobacillus ponti TaxID=2961894 RepID=A0AA42BPK8_9BACI|nr:MBL fold metallo-hydrolase [Ectobacillus ponti]MCP8967644.1 MBL fold metallo-hydrolase [Ectobacillus ponti]
MRTRYENMDKVTNDKTFSDMRRWMKERRAKKKDLSRQIEQYPYKDIRKLHRNQYGFSITWIGHSTFLIQLEGLNILTDPVWAKRMGVQKRLTDPGLAIADLPEIDVVFISHGHYDHLDFGSIRKLKGNPAFYVPAGLKNAFTRRGYRNVVEANWWDSFDHNGLVFTFVPAQHWTRRTMLDTNTSHWGGWMMENKTLRRSVYFVGDTGYFRGFQEIGKRFDIDVVLMPIGAYEPEWFMAVSHINPEDAVKAFQELNGKVFIPMHYGAYRLADDTGPEALERLYHEWDRLLLEENQLKVLALGETLWP